ncbi:alginate lyase family protein [Terriglobus albidus]|uniref:alginate lyase family protein n=1 Tax=Terriglobus albidus TaxID=1592106 RepID=UPI0021E09BE8|nr:alginate lyase family protein [Terriglobus albidus]
MLPAMDRRHFLAIAGAFGLRMHAQVPGLPAGTTRPDVAALDHDRILRLAGIYLQHKPSTITAFPAERSQGTPNDFYSEDPEWFPDVDPEKPWVRHQGERNPNAFHAHGDALLRMAQVIPAFAAAWLITKDAKYISAALLHLRAWFLTPETRMNPSLNHGQAIQGVAEGRATGILETTYLVEVVRAISFLATAEDFPETDLKGLRSWFADYAHWMYDSTLGQGERDTRSIHGICWVAQAGEYSRFANIATISGYCLRRFREVLLTLISLDGNFPAALASPAPYANSIFHLECLALACEVLSTPFESQWTFQTSDGKSLRSAVAFLAPSLESKQQWRYPADAQNFRDLPLRPLSLYLAGRAYQRPEYTAIWKALPPDPADLDNLALLRLYPARQPLLWSRRVPGV